MTLAEDSEVILETSGPSGGNTVMELYDSSLNQIEINDGGGTDLYSRIDRVCDTDELPAGTYYVKIDEYNGDSEIASYDISLTVTPCGIQPDPVLCTTFKVRVYVQTDSFRYAPNQLVSLNVKHLPHHKPHLALNIPMYPDIYPSSSNIPRQFTDIIYSEVKELRVVNLISKYLLFYFRC